ncbi:MAG TPA: zf-HC2 domain-containing protein [Gemmatimonadales bacterium]|nr:zf-HC2 domain-containing protein [Gemmatimonadales bacterium]
MDRLTCEAAFRQLDDYLDRALDAEEMRLIDEHLATCAACLTEFTFERSVLEHVRDKLRDVAVPPELLARISAQLADRTPSPPDPE